MDLTTLQERPALVYGGVALAAILAVFGYWYITAPVPGSPVLFIADESNAEFWTVPPAEGMPSCPDGSATAAQPVFVRCPKDGCYNVFEAYRTRLARPGEASDYGTLYKVPGKTGWFAPSSLVPNDKAKSQAEFLRIQQFETLTCPKCGFSREKPQPGTDPSLRFVPYSKTPK